MLHLSSYDQSLALKLVPGKLVDVPNPGLVRKHDMSPNGSELPGSFAVSIATDLLEPLRKQRKSTPLGSLTMMLQRPQRLPELLMLTTFLGCSLADSKSADLLRQCVSNDWKTPILHDAQIGGLRVQDLHKGTYICDVDDPNSPFLSLFYQVS